MADYYDLLGVARDADPDTLKRSYRRLARQYHPDVNKDPGAEDKFKEIGRAYEVLSDPQTRARYDQFGEAGLGGGGGMPSAPASAPPALRHRHYALAEKILLEDMPLIPLYFNVQNFLIQPNVKNWRTDSLWTRFFSGLTRE